MLRNVAVLLAGGVGSRVGLDIPKQLIKIAGMPIMEHTLGVLDRHPQIDEIIILMAPGHLDAVHAMTRDGRYPKVSKILEGADTRNETTKLALAALPEGEDCNVLLHDAVRPLLSEDVITDCFKALVTYQAVDVAIPSADTIIELNDDNTISQIPDRSRLRRGQTPQAFLASTLKRAYEIADQDPEFRATDDCSVVLKYLPDTKIWVVDGHEQNMKVTEPIDVYIADKLFQLTAHQQFPQKDEADYRAALEGKNMVVFGGSYGIGADIAELAESYGANVASYSRSATGTDVAKRADIVAAAADAGKRFGSIDFVVNTAGVLPRGELATVSEETIYNATEINYIAPVLIAQEFFPYLARAKGSLLFFTSSSYTRGRRGYALYSSAKAATVNLTQALADEWADQGVRVNAINPERTGTPMRTKAFGQEPSHTLLESKAVARASLDTLIASSTGHVIDLRRIDPIQEALDAAAGN
ncbi:bifunctional cytidylyltransferase/SDR family oxidoreductase [Nocardioides sp. NPDC006303]|uniref:bifunctional cytidylyltransferase/SDR family oxidoreductase n=1 Tax=Nocardioides sp. NPDC006303 TaxID=3156747 RepID=UPI0033A3C27B